MMVLLDLLLFLFALVACMHHSQFQYQQDNYSDALMAKHPLLFLTSGTILKYNWLQQFQRYLWTVSNLQSSDALMFTPIISSKLSDLWSYMAFFQWKVNNYGVQITAWWCASFIKVE